MSIPNDHIAGIRTDYRKAALREELAGKDPIAFFSRWFEEAEQAGIEEVNAMTLATVDAQNHPHARIVLLKGLDEQGFMFYTNYDSAKGREMESHPEAAVVFFWKELERQVRIEGRIEKVSAALSDKYFHARPKGSQIGAIASPQSQKITRTALEQNAARLAEKFADQEVPRPDHWGGYCVMPVLIEFWQGRSNRLHDRIVFEKNDGGTWDIYRLAP